MTEEIKVEEERKSMKNAYIIVNVGVIHIHRHGLPSNVEIYGQVVNIRRK